METYKLSLIAVFVIIATMLLQHIVAIGAHRKQRRYVPGIVDPQLSHSSFVFRSHRTFQNSLENVPMMLATIALAIYLGLDADLLAMVVWTFAVARIIHMVLFYAIATEKNPSPRSYFFGIGLIANLILLVLLGLHF
ncbi:MAPEG family protein [uncultured Ferrimonas sp.]|uniref:MAPEG family protein n=1 Tax=uncultured Ferrimonas sp. TaxID=432640 RepID=UPI002601C263|nr:MAPEG family protein [uncultured Ferrimonas sp.]